MALSQKTLAWIAEIAGVSAEDITAGITSEKEVEINRPQGDFFNESQLQTRDSQKYKEGKDAGQEMLIKDFKNQYGYDIEGKDAKAFMEHHEQKLKEKYSQGADERVSSLEADLQKQRETYESEITGLKTNLETLSSRYRQENVRNLLLSSMPKETKIKPDAIVTLFNASYEVDEVDGKTVVKKGGEILKDEKTAMPLEVKEIFSRFVAEEGYATPTNGRGGGNEPGGSTTKYSADSPEEFQRTWVTKNPGKSVASPDFTKDYQEWAKAKQSA